MTITDTLAQAIAAALSDLGVDCDPADVRLERPQRLEHGDWSTNVALTQAKKVGRPPRELAQQLADALNDDRPPHVESVEIAGPGFVNFRLGPGWLHDVLAEVISGGETGYAAPRLSQGERVQVEFVSANPTGPLHVGNGWFGAYGDALARLLTRTGHDVTREFYVNDTGNQIRLLGESVLARRRGDDVPDEGYKGEYLVEIAAGYEGPDDPAAAGRYATERILENIKATLDKLNIGFDEWYSQASIEDSGKVEEVIEELRALGHVYDEGGAVWFRATSFGDSRDRVLVKSNGDFTYLGGDLAYHRNKFLERKFDRVIDVFGADTHGQVASLKAGVAALGVDPARLEVEIGQLISLVGTRMSKRAGNFVRLDTLIDDLGADVTRFLSLVSSLDQAVTIDLDVVKAQSAESPVWYVKYAYARIASIGRVAGERGIDRKAIEDVDVSLLVHPKELDVLRDLSELPRVVREATADRAPYKVTNWVRALAASFHGFYHDCYVMGEGVSLELTQARLWLVEAARIGLAIGLGILGVEAPDKM
ncbi:MAG TPA: arginine--tRNA ligase [Acidimicrobiales bacterium]|jgi:arginyl-tRNA synthetase|nr:arginine--tRNA ligase [Acidimicrobiales bacterium]